MSRTEWIDNAKGQAIFLVVVAHVWRGLRDAGLVQWGPVFAYLDYTVYSFHMPAFFLLAGITAHISDRKVGKEKTRAWIGPIARLYAVYLFWSLFQTSVMLGLSHFTTEQMSVRDIVLIPVKPNAQFWFLLVLIVFRIAARLLPTRILLAVSVCSFAYGALLRPEPLPFELCHFLLFFVVGYRSFGWLGQWLGQRSAGFAFPIVLAALLGLAFAYQRMGVAYDSIPAVALAGCGMLALYCSSRAMGGGGLGKLCGLLGRGSMPIYILHIMAASGVRIVAVRMGFGHQGEALLVICTLAGLALPLCFWLAAQRLGLEGLFTMRWQTIVRPAVEVR